MFYNVVQLRTALVVTPECACLPAGRPGPQSMRRSRRGPGSPSASSRSGCRPARGHPCAPPPAAIRELCDRRPSYEPQSALPRARTSPLWPPPSLLALLESKGEAPQARTVGIEGLTVAWIGAPLSSAPIYAPKAHSVRGDAGWEGREAPWGERSERAGGGRSPPRGGV
jgi:hypothetical protein